MGIQNIKGVGPATVKKLNKAGVRTLADVRGMDADAVAKKTGLDVDRLREWRTEAKMLKVLEDVKGIGPSTKKKLQDAGIHSVDDLARAAIHEVAHATNIATARLKQWQQEANRLVKQADTYVRKEGTVVAEKTRPAREAATLHGKKAAQAARVHGAAAAKKGTEIAHEMRERVGELTQKETPETDDAAAPVAATNGSNGNGQVTILQKLKRIFAKA